MADKCAGIASIGNAELLREAQRRADYIRTLLERSGMKGIVFGNSGGKDCALVGILCKMACDNVTGIILPAGVSRSYGEDRKHALLLAGAFGISSLEIDLALVRQQFVNAMGAALDVSDAAMVNIAPRLRMTALYTAAQSLGCLVAGTGNRSERYVGYFTKHGDGAFDFNPISDLTVTEVYALLRALGAPREVIDKPPSAGLYEGQTDEDELGLTYSQIDRYLLCGDAEPAVAEKIEAAHRRSTHKISAPGYYRQI